MERSRRDEKDVFGREHPVFRLHRRSLDDREKVALDALSRHVGAAPALASDDFVDLVDEDNPKVFGQFDRPRVDLLLVAKEGWGFSFTSYSPDDFLYTFRRAVDFYYDQKEDYQRMSKACMKVDVSWEKSAKEYSDLYSSLL